VGRVCVPCTLCVLVGQGGSGSCFDANTVPFAQDVPSSSCVRVLSGTSADRCASLDVSDFLTNLRIAKAPNSQISDVSTYVTVTTVRQT